MDEYNSNPSLLYIFTAFPGLPLDSISNFSMVSSAKSGKAYFRIFLQSFCCSGKNFKMLHLDFKVDNRLDTITPIDYLNRSCSKLKLKHYIKHFKWIV